MKIRNYINILLIIIWMFTIFVFSNQSSHDSQNLSDKVLIKIVEVIKGHNLTSTEEKQYTKKYRVLIRKSAHFFFYFILTILIIILLIDFDISRKRAYILSLVTCILFAFSDEIHQLFISGRNSSFIDIIIDTSGAICAILLLHIINIVKKKTHVY